MRKRDGGKDREGMNEMKSRKVQPKRARKIKIKR